MDIFGITPIDAAMSSLGLNYAHVISQYIFFQTPLGLCAWVFGFLLSAWQSSQRANFRSLIAYLFFTFATFSLIITPQRTEPVIKSAIEMSYSTNPTAQEIKDSQTIHHQMPVILSFIGQMADAVVMGAIHVMSMAMPTQPKYLEKPWAIHEAAFNARNEIFKGMTDEHLQERLSEFVYANYTPALTMLRQGSAATSELTLLGSDDNKVAALYSREAKEQWRLLKADMTHAIDNPQGQWVKIKEFLREAWLIREEDINKSIISSYVQSQSMPVGDYWGVLQESLRFWPYLQGMANLCMYTFFPVICCLTILSCQPVFIILYGKVFVWVKSWGLTAALTYYGSLLAAQVQYNSGDALMQFWEKPYFCLIAVFLLYLTPVLTGYMFLKQSGMDRHKEAS